jgi:hypothetical protein
VILLCVLLVALVAAIVLPLGGNAGLAAGATLPVALS